MSKTRAQYRIQQRIKYEDTKPERVMEDILTELRVAYRHPFTIYNLDELGLTLTVDFVVEPLGNPCAIEVDGPYHDTPIQQKKTRWRDGLLVKAGYKVVHIDAELTKNRVYQNYLKDAFVEAINSPEKVIRIDA